MSSVKKALHYHLLHRIIKPPNRHVHGSDTDEEQRSVGSLMIAQGDIEIQVVKFKRDVSLLSPYTITQLDQA